MLNDPEIWAYEHKNMLRTDRQNKPIYPFFNFSELCVCVCVCGGVGGRRSIKIISKSTMIYPYKSVLHCTEKNYLSVVITFDLYILTRKQFFLRFIYWNFYTEICVAGNQVNEMICVFVCFVVLCPIINGDGTLV